MNPNQPDLLSHLISTCPFDFPKPSEVDQQGIGIVATGGDLAPNTLLSAYSKGLFPWFNDEEPITWWSPEPRCVLKPSDYQPSKSLRKHTKKSNWITTVNTDFEQVIFNCSLPRNYSDETWITKDMQNAYLQLHDLGYAHSIEVWNDDKQTELIGGLYGLKLGKLFCGESMFHKTTNASKIAFWRLCQLCAQTGVQLIDCQLPNNHLLSLGARIIKREKFLAKLPKLINQHLKDTPSTHWQDIKPAAVFSLLS
ncbi:MAG: leucyl/phenylalanyl-tRNA--protein transferase [Gammaproteobacteria bacterium]|nr:MAG: leucyl/phenylalanyl-tRNA--protein transferase [Gammaproteobacteria bacterium]